MKLKELFENEDDAMTKWLLANAELHKGEFYLADGKVNVSKAVVNMAENVKTLPYPFGDVTGVFCIRGTDITTWENIPESAYIYNLSNVRNITSLVGIEKIIKKLNLRPATQGPYYGITQPTIILGSTRIKRGGLGLINIPNLAKLDVFENEPEMQAAFKIINNYLGRPDDIFECQAELIENGLEAFAEL